MTTTEQLGKLFEDLQRNVELPRQLESSVDNDMGMKTAIIGFSSNSPADSWSFDHYTFVEERLKGSYSAENLQEFGAEATAIRLFVGLCLGYLLGMFQAGKLTDTEFSIVEVQIPGSVFMKSGHFPHL